MKVIYKPSILSFFLLFFLTLSLTSCGGYSEILRNDNYQQKKLYADESFQKKDYAKAIALYEQIYQRMPKDQEGETAYFRMGMSYFYLGDNDNAGYILSNFPIRFPYSDKAEEASYYSVVSAANLSPNYLLDQTDTQKAIDAIQHFLETYSDSKFQSECNELLNKLYGKLELKAFEAVKLYSKMEQYKAANTSADDFLQKYPASLVREQAYYILVKNSYLLAINSVETKKKERIDKAIERYLNFVAEFPNTSYLSEVKGYYNKLNKLVQAI